MEQIKLDIFGLTQAFQYIEKCRSWGVNKGGRSRMSKEMKADLYYAGKYIIDTVRDHGSLDENRRIDQLISDFESSFKD